MTKGVNMNKGTKLKKRKIFRASLNNSYNFPTVCSCCLGPAEEERPALSESFIKGFTRTIQIKFPVCRSCLNHIRRWILFRTLYTIIAILLSYFVGRIGFFLGFIGLILQYLAIPAILIFFYYFIKSRWINRHPNHANPLNPVKISQTEDSILFEFRNNKYGELFSNSNIGEFEE